MADRFDKFTDRARRALQVAQEEAVRLGHGQIGAEHLLLGLLADRTSVAATALTQLGVDLDTLAARAAGPSLSLEPPPPQVGLAASARQAIELAVDEARGLDHHYVGTEHLLLGLLRQESNPAADECRSRGVTLAHARGAIRAVLNAPPTLGAVPAKRATSVLRTPEAVQHLLEQLEQLLANRTDRPPAPEVASALQLSDAAFAVLGFGVDEARRLDHNYIGTEHLLLGLLRVPETRVGHLLGELGVELHKVRDAVEVIIGRGDRAPGEPHFTPRAGKVIVLAIDEAQRLGDPAAGAEHLLLGIVREGEGIANSVLESLLSNPDKIRAQVLEALGQPAPLETPAPLRSDRLSRLARKALLQAQLAARWYYHPQVDTEHLLLGLVRERGGAGARALHEVGGDLARVLEHFEALTSEPSGRATPDRLEYTPAAQSVIERAIQASIERGHPQTGTGHLLLGVLAVEGGRAHTLLHRLTISESQARLAVEPFLIDDED